MEFDGKQFKERVAFEFKLLEFESSRTKTKLIVRLEVPLSAPPTIVFEAQRVLNMAEKYQKMDEIGANDEVKDVGAALRSVYEQADDKTKEAMLRSYNESKGKVVSSTWSE